MSWPRLGSLVAALALVLAGCGGSATPVPGGTSPTPGATIVAGSPSAAAASPLAPVTAAGVVAKLSDPAFAFSASVTGHVVGGGFSQAVVGSEEYSAGDSHSLTVPDVPGVPHPVGRSERTIVGDTVYSRDSETSPWFSAPRASSAGDMAAAIVRVGSLVDQGSATRSGKQVRHFAAAPGSVTAAQLGVLTATITDVAGTLDVYVDESSNLVAFRVSVSAQQTSGGSISIDLDYTITGASPTIVAPSDVWTRFVSTRLGYSIGYPSTVTATEGTKASVPDRFVLPDGESYSVIRATEPQSIKLADLVQAQIAVTRTQYKVKPQTQLDVTIDGRPGKLLEYHVKSGGVSHFMVVAVTLAGVDGYTIAIVANPGSEADTLSFLDVVLVTFRIGH
jgi:hypothetical protein